MKTAILVFSFIFGFLISMVPVSARTYYYDDAGRLIQVSYADGNGVKYSYDAADNIILEEPITIPQAPSNLRVVRDSLTTAQLEWQHVDTTETGFRIQRRTVNSYGWETVGTLGAGANSYADSALSESENYVYRVIATGSSGDSAYSNAVTAADVESEAFEISAFQSSTDSAEARYRFSFESLSGSNYVLESSTTLVPGSWEGVLFATSPNGTADKTAIDGNGSILDLYIVDPGEQKVFYRLKRSDP